MGPEAGLQIMLVTGMLLAGVVDDLRSRKVHNFLVVICLLFSVLTVLSQTSLSLVEAGKSFALAAALGLPLWLFRVIGGGDFKLMLAVSPLVVSHAIFPFFMMSLVWGAILGLVAMALRGQWRPFAHNIVATMVHRKGVNVSNLQKIPFTVALFFGFQSVLVLAQHGGLL